MRVATAVSLLAMVVLATGCTSVDPTDPSHFTDIVVRNDTPTRLVIVQCDTSCDVLHERTSVASGRATTINESNEGITIGYVIERPSGLTLGCLYMRFNHVRQTPVVNITSLSRCR
jgi:hypothetical protein